MRILVVEDEADLNLLLCITDDRQVPQTQKVHF